MPIYEFRCLKCGAEFSGIFKIGTDACRCEECGDFAVLIPSIPAKAKIRPGVSSRGVSAPSLPKERQAVSPGDDKAVKVYNFDFGDYERKNLARLAEQERQNAVSDSYSF